MHKIYFAPLQGNTDYIYRNLHHKYFGGLTKYFTPFLKFEAKKSYKNSSFNDLHPVKSQISNVVPQVLGSDINTFIDTIKIIEDWGYTEVNWNLGCPFPMIVKRGYGSGILNNPDLVDKILNKVLAKTNIQLSIKARLGIENENEIFNQIEVFNKYPLKEIIIHTRTAKQMYKGVANTDIFEKIIESTHHKLIYNGDILSVEDLLVLDKKYKTKINTWMIGRGLLKNPFLAQEINGEFISPEKKMLIIEEFHSELFDAYNSKLQSSHILAKMQVQWEYLSYVFVNQHKVFKSIKKSNNVKKYQEKVNAILSTEKLV